jgi:hypothetical protein
LASFWPDNGNIGVRRHGYWHSPDDVVLTNNSVDAGAHADPARTAGDEHHPALDATPYGLAWSSSTGTKTGSEDPVLSSPKFSPLRTTQSTE